MKLYLITNKKKYTGAVQVTYGMDQVLVKVDFSDTDMTPSARAHMLQVVSALEDSVADGFKSPDTMIVKGEIVVTFEGFWREYPYKRNRFLAEKHWPKMTKAEQAQAFLSAIDYRKMLERKSWQSPMIADKWLKEKQFLNDWKTL